MSIAKFIKGESKKDRLKSVLKKIKDGQTFQYAVVPEDNDLPLFVIAKGKISLDGATRGEITRNGEIFTLIRSDGPQLNGNLQNQITKGFRKARVNIKLSFADNDQEVKPTLNSAQKVEEDYVSEEYHPAIVGAWKKLKAAIDLHKPELQNTDEYKKLVEFETDRYTLIWTWVNMYLKNLDRTFKGETVQNIAASPANVTESEYSSIIGADGNVSEYSTIINPATAAAGDLESEYSSVIRSQDGSDEYSTPIPSNEDKASTYGTAIPADSAEESAASDDARMEAGRLGEAWGMLEIHFDKLTLTKTEELLINKMKQSLHSSPPNNADARKALAYFKKRLPVALAENLMEEFKQNFEKLDALITKSAATDTKIPGLPDQQQMKKLAQEFSTRMNVAPPDIKRAKTLNAFVSSRLAALEPEKNTGP